MPCKGYPVNSIMDGMGVNNWPLCSQQSPVDQYVQRRATKGKNNVTILALIVFSISV